MDLSPEKSASVARRTVLREGDPHIVTAMYDDRRIRVVASSDPIHASWLFRVLIATVEGRETPLDHAPARARTKEDAIAIGLAAGTDAIAYVVGHQIRGCPTSQTPG